MKEYQERKITKESARKNATEQVLLCGYKWWKPNYFRRLGTPRYFLIVFCAQNLLQGASVSYFAENEDLIERHFNFTHRDTGYLLMMSEIGAILTSFLLSYFGGKGNRPRWLSVGGLLYSFGLTLIFAAAVAFPKSEEATSVSTEGYCTSTVSIPQSAPSDLYRTGRGGAGDDACSNPKGKLILVWLIAHTLIGIGGSIGYFVGISYLDDNVKNGDSPLYLAIIISARILGPVVGFSISSMMTPFNSDIYTNSLEAAEWWQMDWWKCSLFFSVLLLLIAVVVGLFPRHMTQPKVKPKFHLETDEGEIFEIEITSPAEKAIMSRLNTALKDLKEALYRLSSNRILLLSIISDFFSYLGGLGFFLWLPKYLEQQFRIDRSEGSLYTGIASSSSVIIGVIGGGLFIRQCRPTTKTLLKVMLICKAAFILSLSGTMFISCDFEDDFPGTFHSELGAPNIEAACSSMCDCTSNKFLPMCIKSDYGSQTYYSPCHAGCPAPMERKLIPLSSVDNFSNCSCLDSRLSSVSLGHCRTTCSQFTLYNMINVVVNSFISIGAIGGLLINIRCVSVGDKTMSLGVKSTAIALAYFMTPVVFGAMAESSCLVWKYSCQNKGSSCSVYDAKDFGYKLHGITACLFFLSLICEILLFLNIKGINIIKDSSKEGFQDSSLIPSSRTSSSALSDRSRKSVFMSSLRKSLFKYNVSVKGDSVVNEHRTNSDSCNQIGELVIRL